MTNNKTRANLSIKQGNQSDLAVKVKPKLNEKQKLALKHLTDFDDEVRTLCYGGGANGGKTFLGCLFIAINALKYPGTRHLLGGKELKKLKHSTLKTLFSEVLPTLKQEDKVDYKYSELKSEIKFKNGSEIIIVDLADRPNDPMCDYLGGLEFFSGFIDEVQRLSENTVNIVQTRIRHKHSYYCKCGTPTFGMKVMGTNPETEIPNEWYCHKCEKRTKGCSAKLLITCNPSRNWLYNEYYKKWKDQLIEPYKAFIQSLTSDNIYGTLEYKRTLERMPKQTRERLLLGSWEYQDELNMFDDDKIADMFEYIDYPDVEPEEQTADVDGFRIQKNYVITIDVARLGEDKSCIIVWDGLKIVHIKELCKMKLNEQLPFIQSIQNKYNVLARNIIVDSDGVGGGLADMIPGCKPIVNNSRPIGGENFQNLKTQLYFKLATYVNEGKIKVKFEDSKSFDKNNFRDRLTQELQVLKRIAHDWDGKVKMTSKEEVKKQISRSPDLSDAMAFRMFLELRSSGWGYDFAMA